jgi:dolichol-phosphate mannosyltransferase
MEQSLALSVVVPTRNEEQNVRVLVERIAKNLDGINYEIVFVDDSTDQTPSIIRELMCNHGNIRMIHRQNEEQKGGLATAVIRGFTEAEGTYICVMDSDLQHPPQMIPTLLEAASGVDIVVASRYRKGGSYEGLSGPFRKFVSVALKEFTRTVFFPKLNKVTDPLSGFFLVRRDILQDVAFAPTGFKILLEILVRCRWKVVHEVPYKFAVRADGKSKANVGQGMSFLLHMMKLFWTVPQTGRFWKFGLVGGLVALIGSGLLYIFVDILSIEKNTAYFVQAFISLQLNFNLNDQFTWVERRGQNGRYWSRWVKFHTTRILSVILSQIFFALLTALGVHYMLVYVMCIMVAMVFNYLTSDRFVFLPTKQGKEV